MTSLLRIIAIALTVFIYLEGHTQKFDEVIDENPNDFIMFNEPEVCSDSSMVSPENLKVVKTQNGLVLKWDPVPLTFRCQVVGGILESENLYKNVIGFEPKKVFIPYSLLEPFKEYSWRVKCACKVNPLTWGEFSDLHYFNTGNFLLPYEEEEAGVIEVYPNPTLEEINFHYNNPVEDGSIIEIYSLGGVLYLSTDLKSGLNIIDTTNLERGYYVLVTRGNNIPIRIPLMKI